MMRSHKDVFTESVANREAQMRSARTYMSTKDGNGRLPAIHPSEILNAVTG